MPKVTYEIVRHDHGWAYKVGDSFSETFDSHDSARRAAEEAAARQEQAGPSEAIQYQDRDGVWHEEVAQGDDRPDTRVEG
jgi:hypothetical protein